MCISQSVGRLGVNTHDDVETIQILLNLNMYRLPPTTPLKEDGAIGPNTISLIEEFQEQFLTAGEPSGTVEPGSATLQELKQGLPQTLTPELLRAIMPGAGGAVIEHYCDALQTAMEANGIDTPLRIAHFLAQVGHESLDMRYAEEIASGSDYENRADLGNTQPGDGERFKGRGLIQLTGRSNYTAYGIHKSRDFVTPMNYALIATDPLLAVDVSCWFWTTHGLNALADSDDVRAVTKAINGGYNGLPDREQRLVRAKRFLMP